MAEYSFEDLVNKVDVKMPDEKVTLLPSFNKVVAMTDKGVLLDFDDIGEKWLPLQRLKVDNEGDVYIETWLYNKEF